MYAEVHCVHVCVRRRKVGRRVWAYLRSVPLVDKGNETLSLGIINFSEENEAET